ncbi:NADP-dependent alcohol dehydrogenase [Capnocytophaga sp. HP1101]
MKKNALTSVLALCIVTLSAQENRVPAKGLAVSEKGGHFHHHNFTRHEVGDNDILIDILYSGICHTDLHQINNDWFDNKFPMVPGHEIAGKVVKVGKNVKKFKVGDFAGVGCMVNSCGECNNCKNDREMFCERQQTVFTYASDDVFHNNENTMGGYSDNIVVSERFAVKIPKNADMKRVAPLLCAGITTYSPIYYSKIKKGDKVGVAGFGGLGHMAVQYLKAKGAEVTVFEITDDKRPEAQKLGAAKYVNIHNANELKEAQNTLSFILITVATQYDPQMYLTTLKEDGEMAIVGQPALNAQSPTLNLVTLPFSARRKVYGSLIGGMKETQQMLDYSVKHNIYPMVEVINADPTAIENAYNNVRDGKVKFRYVIDMKTLKDK